MSKHKVIADHQEPPKQKIERVVQTSNVKLLMSVLARKYSPTRLHTKELASTALKWLNRLPPELATPIRNHMLDSLLSPEDRADMLRQDVSERVMEALHNT